MSRRSEIAQSPAITALVQQIDQLRVAQSVSLETMSEKSGYSTQHIFNLRHGRGAPTVQCLLDMAECVGLGLVLVDADFAEAIAKKRAGGA